MAFLGVSEIALHGVSVITTSLAIGFFYCLVSQPATGNQDWLTVLFALGPAFLPRQSAMVYVPLIAF